MLATREFFYCGSTSGPFRPSWPGPVFEQSIRTGSFGSGRAAQLVSNAAQVLATSLWSFTLRSLQADRGVVCRRRSLPSLPTMTNPHAGGGIRAHTGSCEKLSAQRVSNFDSPATDPTITFLR